MCDIAGVKGGGGGKVGRTNFSEKKVGRLYLYILLQKNTLKNKQKK